MNKRYRYSVTDHSLGGERPKRRPKVTRISVVLPAAVAVPRRVIRDEDRFEAKTESAPSVPPEAFWPLDHYKVETDDKAITVYELTPSGEKRQIKTYPADKFEVDDQNGGGNAIIRRRGISTQDRAAMTDRLRTARLATEAKISAMNAAARDRWARRHAGGTW